MEHNYKSRIINGFVINLKSTIFDVMTSMRRNMDIIEGQIGVAKDEQKELELQQLWAEYHEADKQCLISAKRMEEAMERLDSCFQAYYTCLYQPTSKREASPEETPQEIVSEIAPAEQEATSEEASQEMAPVIAPEQEAMPEVASQEIISEIAPEQETMPEVASQEMAPVIAPEEETSSEEITQEEVGEDVATSETLPQGISSEEKNESIFEASIANDNKEDTNNDISKENVLLEPIPEEPIDNTEAEGNDSSVENTETTSEDSASKETTESVAFEGLLPLIPEEGSSEPEENTEEASNPFESSSLASSPTTEDGIVNAETTIKDDNATPSFTKMGNEEAKAIIVNLKQKNNLSTSLETQQKLLSEPETSVDNELTPQQQMEQLMNQLPTLYEQGDVAKAEEVSEQIRILNEQITPTV